MHFGSHQRTLLLQYKLQAHTYKEETKTGDLLLHLQIMSFTPTEHFQKECDDEHQHFIHINNTILPA